MPNIDLLLRVLIPLFSFNSREKHLPHLRISPTQFVELLLEVDGRAADIAALLRANSNAADARVADLALWLITDRWKVGLEDGGNLSLPLEGFGDADDGFQGHCGGDRGGRKWLLGLHFVLAAVLLVVRDALPLIRSWLSVCFGD